MIDRRSFIRFALATVPAAWLLRSFAAHAQQAFARFIPFLIDLPGWQGKKADGLSMEMPGNSMTTATRQYQRGQARLDASIIIGPAAQGALAATRAGLNIETSDGRVSTSTIDGLTVSRNFNIKQKSGAILAALGTSALFSLSFNGIDDEEALGLAKRFDWKAIQAALPK
jgi:hypothetical protein